MSETAKARLQILYGGSPDGGLALETQTVP